MKPARLPHPSTYRRILETCLDGDEFECVLGEFIAQLPQVGQALVIAIDGKTLPGMIPRDDPFGLHLLAAYPPGEGVVLMHMVVKKDQENETGVAAQLLRRLDLRQKVVVADARHAQRSLSLQILAAGGDYVWVVKDNQPATRQAIEQLFAPEKPLAGVGCFQRARTVNKAQCEQGLLDAWKNGSSPSVACSKIIWLGLVWPRCSSWNGALLIWRREQWIRKCAMD